MVRITDYFSRLFEAIRDNAWIRTEDIAFREIEESEGYIRGILYLHDGNELHVAEYVAIKNGLPKTEKYRFQLQTPDGAFLSRWDNAPHHKTVSSFPHHKHCSNENVVSSSIRNIIQMLGALDDEL